MTIQEFIKNPLPYNRALTVGLIEHALRIHKNCTGEDMKIDLGEYAQYDEDWKTKADISMRESIKDSTVEELNQAADLMISGWSRAVIMREIEDQENLSSN